MNDLILYFNNSKEIKVSVKDADSNPYVITGYTGQLIIASSLTSSTLTGYTSTSYEGTDTIVFTIPKNNALPVGSYKYEVQLVSDSEVITVVQDDLLIKPSLEL